MQENEKMKILFVINPVSGGKEKTDWENRIRTYFKSSPHEMEFYLLTGKSDNASVAHHIETVKPNRVVAVGGDGTVKLAAEILQNKNIPLAIIPAGSANGMAKELEIPDNVDAALEIAVNGIEKNIDVISINDEEISMHLSDIGLNAMIVKYFDETKKEACGAMVKLFSKQCGKNKKCT